MPEATTRDPRLDEPYSPEELQEAREWCISHSLPVNQREVADIAMVLRAKKLGLFDDFLAVMNDNNGDPNGKFAG
jgi:hypothetical protein